MNYIIVLNMSTYADILNHSPESVPCECKNNYTSWDVIKHTIQREMYMLQLAKNPIDRMYATKMNVILEENGYALYNKLKELQEYYDLQGFMDNFDMSSFARMLQKHIHLEETVDLEENDQETLSDWDDN